MSDFMDGDKFPNRPQHEDFWAIASILLQLDGRISEDGGLPTEELERDDIDIASVIYAATQRILRLTESLGQNPTSVETLSIYASLWIEGFIVGNRFRKGGK